MFAEETGLDKNAVRIILTDHLHMWKNNAQTLLSVEQKVVEEFVKIYWKDPKLNQISWIQ